MCRFIAVMSSNPFDPEPYLTELEKQARYGKNSPHGDGWGIWLKDDKREILHKEIVPIWESDFKFPYAKIMIAHARKKGREGARKSLLNTHPFIKNNSVFIHNGMVKLERHLYSVGETDSESYFLYLLDMGLLRGLQFISENYFFTSLNSVLYKDRKMYVIRLTRKMEDYYTIFIKKEDGKIIITTEGDGKMIPNNTVAIINKNLKISYRRIFQDRFHPEDKPQNPL
ncbi:MAG: class II glutamine amidotransferase [Thermoplasmata archaeon]|nr:class II glutamine amidotransferase [Thermoplasmata archaeon]